MGRPKGSKQSPEARAKISAALRERWKNPEYRAFIRSLHLGGGNYRTPEYRAKMTTRPPAGTPERKVFDKVAQILGAAAAHREMRP
jgi:hypothetical protein